MGGVQLGLAGALALALGAGAAVVERGADADLATLAGLGGVAAAGVAAFGWFGADKLVLKPVGELVVAELGFVDGGCAAGATAGVVRVGTTKSKANR